MSQVLIQSPPWEVATKLSALRAKWGSLQAVSKTFSIAKSPESSPDVEDQNDPIHILFAKQLTADVPTALILDARSRQKTIDFWQTQTRNTPHRMFQWQGLDGWSKEYLVNSVEFRRWARTKWRSVKNAHLRQVFMLGCVWASAQDQKVLQHLLGTQYSVLTHSQIWAQNIITQPPSQIQVQFTLPPIAADWVRIEACLQQKIAKNQRLP